MTSLLLCVLLAQSVPAKVPVILDHDGGTPDDLVALSILTRMENVNLLGVIVSPGVSYTAPAISASRKILDLAGVHDVPVARSLSRLLNPFPTSWRRRVYIADALPVLNQKKVVSPLSSESGEKLIVRLIQSSSQPVTVLVTGPLSTLRNALKLQPAIASKIDRIIWMGGALKVPGNVFPSDEPAHDGTAEWNVYADPSAASEVLKTKIPIWLVPLDTTDQFPVSADFLHELGSQRKDVLADFAGQVLALPFADGGSFYFWDVLAAAAVGKPQIFQRTEWEISVVEEGPGQGRTVIRPGSGRKVHVLENANRLMFQQYVLQLLNPKQ